MSALTSRARGSRFVLAVGVAAALLLGARGTLAFWSDATPVAPGTIKSGSVDLKLNGTDNTSFGSLSISGMVPGNSTAAVIVVRNAGLSPLTYGVDAVATNPDGKNLGQALLVKVTSAAVVTGTGRGRSCAGSALATSGSAFTASLIPAASRTLQPGTQETLCIQAVLPNVPPYSTTSDVQSATTFVTLAFHASQEIS